MSGVRPRQLVHRGVVLASGIAFDTALMGERQARLRALQLWTPGATVQHAGTLLIVTFEAKRRLDADTAPGTVLVGDGGRLLGAPLSPPEIALLGGATDDLVVVSQGAAIRIDRRQAPLEDPSSWLELGDLHNLSVEPLGSDPQPITGGETLPADARALLGMPPGSDERRQVLQALRSPQSGTPTRASAVRFLGFLARLLAFFVPSPSEIEGDPSSSSETDGPRPLARPSLGARLTAWLTNAVARALVHARLAHHIGARHAEHLQRVLEMIDRGDYEQALRHAIPVDGPHDDEAAHVALRAATTRTSLAIRPAETRARAIVPMGEEVQDHLRRSYRGAFERLVALGRNEEAAFVLAELLHANEEAVSFLEKVGKKRLAAQLAEARSLPPGLVVRQWFVAGDVDRAVAVARRTGAFADAVARLERRSKEDAIGLRIAWAESLARVGDFSTAHEVIWPIESARPLARRWIELAIEAGGPGAARALVRKLTTEPEAFEETLPLLDEALRDPEAGVVLARTLLEVASFTPALRAVARRAARAALRLPMSAETRKRLVPKLVERSRDAALRADLPALLGGAPVRLCELAEPMVHRVARAASHGAPPHDAVRLPDGRTLVAFGEGGATILSRDGRVVFSVDQPADTLVVSDAGDRALGLARRGDVVRVTRIDLSGRRAAHWQDMRLDRWARDFDGREWFVARERVILAIDVSTDEHAAASWRVDVESPVGDLVRSRSALAAWVEPSAIWRYELPSMTLRSRAPVSFEAAHAAALASTGAMALLEVSDIPGQEGMFRLVIPSKEASAPTTRGRDLLLPASRLLLDEEWVVAVGDDGVVRLIDRQRHTECARVELDGRWIHSRLYAGTLTLIAESGVVVHVNLASGQAYFLRPQLAVAAH